MKTIFYYPVDPNTRISRGYIVKWFGSHKALDFACVLNTPIFPSQEGVVQWIKDEGTKNYGKSVWIAHDLNGEKLMSIYAHLNRVNVQVDDYVSPEFIIGLSGNTGASGGPHLHLEVRNSHSRWSSPVNFLPLFPYFRKS